MILPVVFVFTVAAPPEIFTLSLHDALPISLNVPVAVPPFVMATDPAGVEAVPGEMLSLTNTVHVTCWQIGRASCREGVKISVAAVSLKKKLVVAGPLWLWTPTVAV